VADVVSRPAFWRGRRVLLTGHTGFKGGWLALWLHEHGARVTGLALPVSTDPSVFDRLAIGRRIDSRIGDVRDPDAVAAAFAASQPELVFHLAAQPIVRTSYDDPVGTYTTNVVGSLNVLEAARRAGVGGVVMVTTDKVYRNDGAGRAFREDDPLGGVDPYSSSKACAELVTASYRDTFAVPVVAARAGNVIGGGDRSPDRIVPDIVRAWERGESVVLRNPAAVRPWQHVADALSGYVLIAQRLLDGTRVPSGAYNFGPPPVDRRSVAELATALIAGLGGGIGIEIVPRADGKEEAPTLSLDPSLAERELGWRQRYDVESAAAATAAWYRTAADAHADLAELTLEQLGALVTR
jgi:CDP-glucose 4,6-dehydratase